MSIRTLASAVLALVALLVVALAPSGASAHGGVPHAHAKHVNDGFASRVVDAAQTELRSQVPALLDIQTDAACDRGCCASGHCSGCGALIAPAFWTALRLPAQAVRVNPDLAPPPGLAFEGPPRPPKFLA